jgi:hypothetical protein
LPDFVLQNSKLKPEVILVVAEKELCEFIFELSHEIIHVLSPTTRRDVTNLEEGLATDFSDKYTNDNFCSNFHTQNQKYIKVMLLARELLKDNPDIIKNILKKKNFISNIQKDDFIKEKIKEDLAKELVKKFNQ